MSAPSFEPVSPWICGAEAIGAYAGVHPETVTAAARKGELVAHQFAKRGTWRAKPADIDAWIEGRATARQKLRAARKLHSAGGR